MPNRLVRLPWRLLTCSASLALTLLAGACEPAPTAPPAPRIPPASAAADDEPLPPSGSVELTVGGEAPLSGREQQVAYYPSLTLVEMTVHQDFAVSSVPPFPPSHGQLGLAGRISGFGCSHQGEAYLIAYLDDEGGYAFPFAGCQLWEGPLRTTFTDTVGVLGAVRYGFSFDSACPYPDYACALYSGSSGVSLRPLTAELTITGDSLHGGVLAAWPWHEYRLVATAVPDYLGRSQTPIQPVGTGWTFTPDSGEAQTHFCGDARTCTSTFFQPGTVSLRARVNGVQKTAPPVRIQVPTLALALSRDSVAVGDTVVVTTTLAGADPGLLESKLDWYDVRVDPMPGAPVIRSAQAEGAASRTPDFSASRSVAPLAARPSLSGAGLPPCLGTSYPAPTHCYLVLAQAGRMLVEAQASLAPGLRLQAQGHVVVGGGTLTVKLALQQDTIRPTVRYWTFNAKTKSYTLKLGGAFAPDTSRDLITVSVVDGAGRPVPDARVNLRLAAHELTAGHAHEGGKPTGSLETMERAPLSDGVVSAGVSGIAKALYVAPEVSGPVTIVATSADARADSATIVVALPGLVPLGPGPHYVFTGAIAGRHTANHYGAPRALAAFQTLADSVHAWTGEPLGINDISLPQGGLFDVGDRSWVPWDIPHGYHRKGTHADIRTHFANGREFPDSLKANIETVWHRRLKHGTIVTEGDHLHVQFYQ